MCRYLLVGFWDNIKELKISMPGKMQLVNVISNLEDGINKFWNVVNRGVASS